MFPKKKGEKGESPTIYGKKGKGKRRKGGLNLFNREKHKEKGPLVFLKKKKKKKGG